MRKKSRLGWAVSAGADRRRIRPNREYLRRCVLSRRPRVRLVEGILRRVLVCFRPAGPMPVVDAEQVLRVIYRWYQTANFAREEAEHGREEKPAVSYENP